MRCEGGEGWRGEGGDGGVSCRGTTAPALLETQVGSSLRRATVETKIPVKTVYRTVVNIEFLHVALKVSLAHLRRPECLRQLLPTPLDGEDVPPQEEEDGAQWNELWFRE